MASALAFANQCRGIFRIDFEDAIIVSLAPPETAALIGVMASLQPVGEVFLGRRGIEDGEYQSNQYKNDDADSSFILKSPEQNLHQTDAEHLSGKRRYYLHHICRIAAFSGRTIAASIPLTLIL